MPFLIPFEGTRLEFAKIKPYFDFCLEVPGRDADVRKT